MRTSALCLLLLTSCGRAEDAERVRDLLSRTPIPVDRLRDAFEIKPGELELLGGDPPAFYDASAPPVWAVMNRGTRPLWLHRDDLTVQAIVYPLLSTTRLPRGNIRSPDGTRPVFETSEWILLLPLEQAPLRVPAPGVWGQVQWSVRIGDAGRWLYTEADTFNAKCRKDSPSDWEIALEKPLGESTHLPPFTWDGGAGQQALITLDVRCVGDGELVWEASFPGTGDRPTPLALWAYIMSDDRRLLYEGRLDSVSHQSGGGKLSTRYVVPAALPPGTHRLLAMGQYAGQYLEPGTDRRGVSLWIPFQIK